MLAVSTEILPAAAAAAAASVAFLEVCLVQFLILIRWDLILCF